MNLLNKFPELIEISNLNEVFWINKNLKNYNDSIKTIDLNVDNIKDAQDRLLRFSSYFIKAFPETTQNNGIIESELKPIPWAKNRIDSFYNIKTKGNLYLKCDSHLPISGSIKARGGIYEIIKYAENLAIKNNMLSLDDDYSKLDSDEFRKFFSNYSIAVGSTGNLGLSIGIISAKLGFKVYVHMSSDAKKWKKDLLRSKGVNVVEYDSDFSYAVEEGRKQSLNNPNMYFVDDENSADLFLGYSVAAYRLKEQLDSKNIVVDDRHPLFVYLPCGVGGAPGGIAFGLKTIFKDNVHVFFVEPTHSPSMLIGLITDLHDKVSVYDIGIDNKTDADGLAVGRPSGFVGKNIKNMISGIYTINDNKLYELLSILADTQNIYVEPSAASSLYGITSLFKNNEYILKNRLENNLENITHIAWATGGNMVPNDIMTQYYLNGVTKHNKDLKWH